MHTHARVPTKIWKRNSMTFPWLICFFPWLSFSHGFRYGYDCISQHARQSQTRKLPWPWEHANSMTFPWLFGKFSYSKTFPWLSMTELFSRIFHDRGNPGMRASISISGVWKQMQLSNISRDTNSTFQHTVFQQGCSHTFTHRSLHLEVTAFAQQCSFAPSVPVTSMVPLWL